MAVSVDDLRRAQDRIRGLVVRTPLIRSVSLSERVGSEVFLKLEIAQAIGAFKIRGASNCVATLDAEQCAGVVTVSTGNHGRAVAAAARRAGIRAVVCMSNLVPENKRKAIAALGAEILIVGRSQDEAEVEANRLVVDEQLAMVHPFDDPHVIAGQGTIGLEILEDLPDVDMVLAGLSGGGLLGGIALGIKATNREARMIGVSMQNGPAMIRSLEAGRPVEVAEGATLADSLGGGIGLKNQHTFELVRELVDETVLLSEEEIATGMRHLYFEESLVAEGAGAVGVAALLGGKLSSLGTKIVVVVSGRNVDMRQHSALMQAGV